MPALAARRVAEGPVVSLALLVEDLVFAWPWLAFALPLPLLALLLPPARRDATGGALRVPAGGGFAALAEAGDVRGVLITPRTLLGLLAWCLLVAAAMRPQLLADAQAAPLTGRNLMLAVDLSGSMEAKDFELAGRAEPQLVIFPGEHLIERNVGGQQGLFILDDGIFDPGDQLFEGDLVLQVDLVFVHIQGVE